jgi:outer membrane protein OmpA-like peptidoglycan-associated protein
MTRTELISKKIAADTLRNALVAAVLCIAAAACTQTPAITEPAAHSAAEPVTGAQAGGPNGAAPAATPPAAAVPSTAAANAAAVAAPAASPPPPPPPPVLPFDQAVDFAAHAVLRNAPPPDAATAIVIDPLIDGMTGYQSKATKSIQNRIEAMVKSEFPQYTVRRLSAEALKQQPRILVGTFTPVTAKMQTSGGEREFFRFCLVMGDLKTGKVIAKQVVRVPLVEADSTPTAVFADSPVWTEDPSVKAYVATCQASKVGDPIKPEYFDGLLAAALVAEAGDAYDEGHYAEALDLYTTARKTPAGDQLRVYNGIYLSLTKLGRGTQAAAAFGDLVDYGLRTRRLAVKILFRPGSVRFASEAAFSATYDSWLQQIANRAVMTQTCLQVVGHTSPTGPAAMNDSLSLLRAEYVQSRLEGDEPSLKRRTVAFGVGSRENLIGTGRDDASDMLDRRVEFKPIEPCG